MDVPDDDMFGDDGLIGGDGLTDDPDGDLLSPTGSSELPSPVPRKSFSELKREFMINAMNSQWNTVETTVIYDNGTNETIFAHSPLNPIEHVDINDGDINCSERFWNGIEACFLKCSCSGSFKTSNVYRNTITAFNTVDRWASRLFPLMFVTGIFIYWSSYTYLL